MYVTVNRIKMYYNLWWRWTLDDSFGDMIGEIASFVNKPRDTKKNKLITFENRIMGEQTNK